MSWPWQPLWHQQLRHFTYWCHLVKTTFFSPFPKPSSLSHHRGTMCIYNDEMPNLEMKNSGEKLTVQVILTWQFLWQHMQRPVVQLSTTWAGWPLTCGLSPCTRSYSRRRNAKIKSVKRSICNTENSPDKMCVQHRIVYAYFQS